MASLVPEPIEKCAVCQRISNDTSSQKPVLVFYQQENYPFDCESSEMPAGSFYKITLPR